MLLFPHQMHLFECLLYATHCAGRNPQNGAVGRRDNESQSSDEGRQTQRFQVHPRSLGQRADARFSQGRARACPPPRCPSSVTQGLLLDLEEIPVGRAQCQGRKLSLFHADLAKPSQPTSTVSGLQAPAQARRDATSLIVLGLLSSPAPFPGGEGGRERVVAPGSLTYDH